MGDGISHLDLRRGLDAGNDVAHIAAGHFLCRAHLHFQHADLIGRVFLAGIEELDPVSGMESAVLDFEIGDDAAERIEYRVENQCLKRCLRVALRGRNLLHYGIQDFRNALSCTCRYLVNLLRLASEQVADLVCNHLRTSRVHINLVQHRNDFQAVLDGLIQIGNSLSLNTLRGVHHQQRALAGCDRAGHLIGEVHVARSIDQVENVFLPLVGVLHLDCMALDGDALLFLEVHVIQHLVLHFPGAQSLCQFNEPVGKCTLAVVNVGDNAEVPDIFHKMLFFIISAYGMEQCQKVVLKLLGYDLVPAILHLLDEVGHELADRVEFSVGIVEEIQVECC